MKTPMPESTKYALASLLDREAFDPCRLYVRWTERWGGPDGDRYKREWFDETNDPAEATDVAIPHTVSGDYVGSYGELANLKALNEEYGDMLPLWVRSMSYGASELMLDLQEIPGEAEPEFWDELECFCEAVESLFSYPLLDDMLYDEICMDAFNEAWNAWVRSDLIHDADKYFHETFGRYPSPEEATAMERKADTFALDSRWEWEVEGGGLNVYWSGLSTDYATDSRASDAAVALVEDLQAEDPNFGSLDPVHNGRDGYDSFKRRVSQKNSHAATVHLAETWAPVPLSR